MATPTITINGEEKTIKTKARLWRVMAEFNEKRKNLSSADFVEEHCKVIATACGLTLDEVLDNMEISDVVPVCLKIIDYVGEQLTAKTLKKSQGAEELI